MCRYGFKRYKPHFACFRCRKAFKRRLKEDVDPAGPDRPARCPQCGLLMADMGLDFQSPKRRDAKAWSALESLWSVGLTFHSCGCGGPGWRPSNPRDLAKFFDQMILEYEDTVRRLKESAPEQADLGRARADAIQYWTGRLQAIREARSASAL